MSEHILLIEDEENLRLVMEAALVRVGYRVHAYDSFETAKGSLQDQLFDLVITDLQLPGASGLEVLSQLKSKTPEVPIVLVTAFGTVDVAVDAMKRGAFDFISKPFEIPSFLQVIEKAIFSRRKRKMDPIEDVFYAEGLGPLPIPLMGESEEIVSLRQEILQMKSQGTPVWIEGEVGTGKRSVAFEIHRNSEFRRGPFVEFHPQAVSDVFHVFELFGVDSRNRSHGLFPRPGRMELARQGSLFIEDLTKLSEECQVHFLKALEEGVFSRSGGLQSWKIDFRIFSSVSVPEFDTGQKKGSLIQELRDALQVSVIHLSPLRERRQDLEETFIPFFWKRAFQKLGKKEQEIPPQLFAQYVQSPWLGNLGELERTLLSDASKLSS